MSDSMPGFSSPNYTQVPNDLFDSIMADMDMAELKVVLAIVRQTIGYHRDKATYSVSKIQKMTGMAYNSVVKGAELAEKRGLIRRINPNEQGSAEWEAIIEPPSKNEGIPPQNLKHTPSKFEGQVGLNKDKEKDKDTEIIESANKTVDAMLAFEAKGQEKLSPRNAMWDRADKALSKIKYNLSGARQSEQDSFISFLLAEEKKGRTIERFVEWVFGDEFWVDKISGLNKVKELWLRQTEGVTRNEDGSLYV